jgi:hypothetical protein
MEQKLRETWRRAEPGPCPVSIDQRSVNEAEIGVNEDVSAPTSPRAACRRHGLRGERRPCPLQLPDVSWRGRCFAGTEWPVEGSEGARRPLRRDAAKGRSSPRTFGSASHSSKRLSSAWRSAHRSDPPPPSKTSGPGSRPAPRRGPCERGSPRPRGGPAGRPVRLHGGSRRARATSTVPPLPSRRGRVDRQLLPAPGLHREINTIGSKASDADISRETVLLKEEVERLREQVQNLGDDGPIGARSRS